MLELNELARLFDKSTLISQTSATKHMTSIQNQKHKTPSTPSNSPDDNSSSKKPPVYFVGQEKNSVFLLARDDIYLDRTCIQLIKIIASNQIMTSVLYVFDKIVKCLSASVNSSGTVLAYTLFTKGKETSNQVGTPDAEGGKYTTYLVELQNKNQIMHYQFEGSHFQKIQFIYHNVNRSCSYYNFLYMKEKNKISMYRLFTEKSKNITLIKNQPESHSVYAYHHIWAQWDPEYSLLYSLEKCASKQNGSPVTNPKEQTMNCILKCCSFSIPDRPAKIFEYVIPVKFAKKVPNSGVLKSKYENFPWRNGHCSIDNSMLFQIVKMNNGICFCQQHVRYKNIHDHEAFAYNTSDNRQNEPFTIDITIYVLHHRVKIDYSIPVNHLNNVNPLDYPELRVFFGHCNNLLVIYLPGSHLQFLDVCSDHKPIPSLRFDGRYAPHLPFFYNSVEMALGIHTTLGSGPNAVNMLLNLKKGIVYSYHINKQALKNWVQDMNEDKDLVSLIHIITIHLKDYNFLDEIMDILLSYKYRTRLSEAIEEYLTAITYSRCDEKVEKTYLQFIPISTIERRDIQDFPDFKIQNFPNSEIEQRGSMTVRTPHKHCTSYMLKSALSYKSFGRRRSVSTSPGPTSPNFASSLSESPPIKTVLSKWFSLPPFFSKTAGNSKLYQLTDAQVVEDIYCIYSKRLFNDTLLEVLLTGNRDSKIKQTLPKFVSDYTIILANEVKELFKKIRKEEYTAQYFRVIECFNNALEESCFPIPNEFTSHFGMVAYHVLSRSLFMQYISRGIIKVTDDLLKHIYGELFDSPKKTANNLYTIQDNEIFFSFLLQRLHETELQMLYFEKLLLNSPILIDHYHRCLSVGSETPFDTLADDYNQLTIARCDQNQANDTAITDKFENILQNISFVPLIYFLLSLNARKNCNFPNGNGTSGINTPAIHNIDASFNIGTTQSYLSNIASIFNGVAKDDGDIDNLELSDSDTATEDNNIYDRNTNFIFENAKKILEGYTPIK
jgi:hypothetical protein